MILLVLEDFWHLDDIWVEVCCIANSILRKETSSRHGIAIPPLPAGDYDRATATMFAVEHLCSLSKLHGFVRSFAHGRVICFLCPCLSPYLSLSISLGALG